MRIVLRITNQAAEDFAAFYGHTDPDTLEQFVTDKLLERITNDLTEKRNRDAVAAVQDEPVVVKEAA